MYKEEPKDIHKSLRLSRSTYDYINSFDGDNFNQKFARLMDFFCREEERKKKQLSEYDRQIEKRSQDLQNITQKIAKIYTLNRDTNALFNCIDQIEAKAKVLNATINEIIEK